MCIYIYSDILSDILSGIYSDVLSGMSSGPDAFHSILRYGEELHRCENLKVLSWQVKSQFY